MGLVEDVEVGVGGALLVNDDGVVLDMCDSTHYVRFAIYYSLCHSSTLLYSSLTISQVCTVLYFLRSIVPSLVFRHFITSSSYTFVVSYFRRFVAPHVIVPHSSFVVPPCAVYNVPCTGVCGVQCTMH